MIPYLADLLRISICTLVLAGVISSSVLAEENLFKLEPSDESERDQSFLEFRNQFQQAVSFREPERLVTMVDFAVLNGVLAPNGMKAFAERWNIDSIESPIWEVLDSIMKLGGGFVRSNRGVQYCAPYVFTHFPSELDPKKYVAIIDKQVPLKAEADFTSDTKEILSYDIVELLNSEDIKNPQIEWLQVKLHDGLNGFVSRSAVRSPRDYQACFLLRKQKWRMISLFSQF